MLLCTDDSSLGMPFGMGPKRGRIGSGPDVLAALVDAHKWTK